MNAPRGVGTYRDIFLLALAGRPTNSWAQIVSTRRPGSEAKMLPAQQYIARSSRWCLRRSQPWSAILSRRVAVARQLADLPLSGRRPGTFSVAPTAVLDSSRHL